MNSLNEINILDDIDFDKVIFLIGSSNHHEINELKYGIRFECLSIQQSFSIFFK